jgi:hypothetical protein
LLGEICCQYRIEKICKESRTRLADCATYDSGWRGLITFYEPFFEWLSIWEQLDTITHEHIHLMMGPMEQALTADRVPDSKDSQESN